MFIPCVFIALVLILILLKVFKSDVISLVEEEKNTSYNRGCFSNGNKARVFVFGRVTGKNEIKIVSTCGK